jgi:hypothetical protein
MFLALIIFVAVVSLLAVGGGLVVAARRRAALGSGERPALGSGAGPAGLLERTLRDIRVGDVVEQGGKDFLVEGVIAYEEDGHRWSSARVLDGHDERWLVVGHERGGTMTVRVMALDPAIEISGYPPEQLDVAETRFTQDKRGTATAQPTGETGAIGEGGPAGSASRCRWWRYEAAGDDSLLIEQWGTVFVVLRGKKVDPGTLDLMQAS